MSELLLTSCSSYSWHYCTSHYTKIMFSLRPADQSEPKNSPCLLYNTLWHYIIYNILHHIMCLTTPLWKSVGFGVCPLQNSHTSRDCMDCRCESRISPLLRGTLLWVSLPASFSSSVVRCVSCCASLFSLLSLPSLPLSFSRFSPPRSRLLSLRPAGTFWPCAFSAFCCCWRNRVTHGTNQFPFDNINRAITLSTQKC